MEIETIVPREISQPPELVSLLNSSRATLTDILTQPLTFRLFRQEDPQILDLYVFCFSN